jgi:hypothetical protein
MAVLL